MHAATVYMACRLEHNPRTFKEILAGAPGTSKVRRAHASRAWGSRFRHEVHKASSGSAGAQLCASRRTLCPAPPECLTYSQRARKPKELERVLDTPSELWDCRVGLLLLDAGLTQCAACLLGVQAAQFDNLVLSDPLEEAPERQAEGQDLVNNYII